MRLWSRRTTSLGLFLSDLMAIAVSFEGAKHLRPLLNPWFRAQLDAAMLEYLAPPLGLLLILWAIASLWLGLYRPRRGHILRAATTQIAEAMILVTVLTIVVTFFVRDLGTDFSRSFVIFMAVLGVLTMLAFRSILWLGRRAAGRRGRWKERILVVGRGHGAKSLIARLEKTAARTATVCGVVVPGPAEPGVLGNPVPIVGTIADLPALINRHRIDRVIAVEKEVPADRLHACIATCTRMGVPFGRTAGLLEHASTRVELAEIGNVALIEVRGLEFTRMQEAAKRGFDVAVAGAVLLALAPLLLALAALVRLTSPGPVFYVASRVGRGGRYFPFLKFRSMVRDADARRDDLQAMNEQSGHLFKMGADPRVTRLGRFMRRFSLDELPQLLSVLRGDMSLVGPRPLPARDLDADGLSREHRFWALQRTRVPPGITGLWQTSGRSGLSFEDMLRLDVAYVRHWSLGLDVRILLRTIPVVLRGRGAF